MPMTLQLDAVNFGINPVRDEAGAMQAVVLVFADPSGIGQVVVPFQAEAWENFKRHVAADGAVTPIALARDLNGVPRMDVPKGL